MQAPLVSLSPSTMLLFIVEKPIRLSILFHYARFQFPRHFFQRWIVTLLDPRSRSTTYDCDTQKNKKFPEKTSKTTTSLFNKRRVHHASCNRMKEVEQTKTQPETNTTGTQTFSSSSLAIPIRLDWELHHTCSSSSPRVLQVSTIRTSTTFSPRLQLLAFVLTEVLVMTLTNKLILCRFLNCRQEEEILSHMMISPRHLVVMRDMLNGPFALL